MSNKAFNGSTELGNKIRQRRNELGYTIETAASKAGIGTKTWSRYEAGGSIRSDKILNICKVLNWNKIPCVEDDEIEFSISEYKNNELWSTFIADNYGDTAAISFIIGSDILLDYIKYDLEGLSCRPKGAHVGELDISWSKDELPPQFLTGYNYDFLYYLKTILLKYRNFAVHNIPIIAHTVAEEIVLYSIVEESKFLMESVIPQLCPDEDDWEDWIFDLLGDGDLVTFLYSDFYLDKHHPYHFNNWEKEQFYCDK